MHNWQTHFIDTNGKKHLPAVFIVCNFSSSTKETPSLLKHSDIVTLFHEMGHGIHHLFSKCHGILCIWSKLYCMGCSKNPFSIFRKLRFWKRRYLKKVWLFLFSTGRNLMRWRGYLVRLKERQKLFNLGLRFP